MISPVDDSLLLTFSASLAALVAAVVVLRAFFTFWGPLDRKLNGQRPGAARPGEAELNISLSEIRGTVLNVHLVSGAVLAGVALAGRCEADDHDFYEVSPLLVLRALDGREYLVRAEQIEYFERVLAATPGAAPHAPGSGASDPDDPENWQVGA